MLVAVTLVAGAVFAPAPAFAHPSSFPDVAESLPSHDAIEFLSGAGVISGFSNGTFGPGDTLMRGQATKILVLWREVPLVTNKCTFPDLDGTYRSYVETACAEGWITGFDNGRFKPYLTLTREQMAIIMVRVMGWEAQALQLSDTEQDGILAPFSDQPDVASVARPYVAMAVSKGLFGGGDDGLFRPKDGITRGQFCLVVLRAELSMRAVIEDVQSVKDYDDRTRVVFELSRAPGTVTAAVSASRTLTVDYTGGAIAGTLSEAIESLEIESVGASQLKYDPRTVRITLDLGRYQRFRIMSLAPSDGMGYRIAVDVYRRFDGPLGDGPPLICVDPGHGGKDPGAIGVSGSKEKDVNLAMSLLLAEDLREAGLEVIMTREDDSYPTLQERAEMANAARASLFVSVHNNAAASSSANGTETFYWGTPEAYSVAGKLLAEAIQRNLLNAIGSTDRGAKTHWYNLVVLDQTEMPAALVEVGFLTNAAEEAKLLTASYQQTAAEGITNGILEYLQWSTKVYSTES